jgi:hypothetical protein
MESFKLTPNKHIVQSGQNVFDVLIQTTGSIEGLFQIVEANSDILTEVSANIAIGDELIIPDDIIKSNVVLTDYQKKKIVVATGTEKQEGIGYWTIEEDFEII